MDKLNEKYRIISDRAEEISDLFYQQKANDGFKQMDTLLLELDRTLSLLYEKLDNESSNLVKKDIDNLLQNLMTAIDYRDTLAIVDIINYEILVYITYCIASMNHNVNGS